MKALLCLALCSCAYHQSFDNTRVASVQDSVIDGLLPVSRLHEFDSYTRAQEAVAPTNLTCRQHKLQGDSMKAEAQARELIRGGYWAEGPGYYWYTRRAWK